MRQEYRILIPVGPDPQSVHPIEKWDCLRHGLIKLAGGYTDTGIVEGAWLDDGEIYREWCRQFLVSVTHDQVAKLFAMFYEFCPKYEQKTIYIANGSQSWLVSSEKDEPPAEDDRNWAKEALLRGVGKPQSWYSKVEGELPTLDRAASQPANSIARFQPSLS